MWLGLWWWKFRILNRFLFCGQVFTISHFCTGRPTYILKTCKGWTEIRSMLGAPIKYMYTVNTKEKSVSLHFTIIFTKIWPWNFRIWKTSFKYFVYQMWNARHPHWHVPVQCNMPNSTAEISGGKWLSLESKIRDKKPDAVQLLNHQ
jgi:hypothetical protein